jgi:hypothetical protein
MHPQETTLPSQEVHGAQVALNHATVGTSRDGADGLKSFFLLKKKDPDLS